MQLKQQSEAPNDEDLSTFPDPDSTYEEDMQILRVIEASCTTNRRQTQAQLGKVIEYVIPRIFVFYYPYMGWTLPN